MTEQYSDEQWYMQLLEKDSVTKQLNCSQKAAIINHSMQEAEDQLPHMKERLGEFGSPQESLRRLGFPAVAEDSPLMPSFLYMGLLVPDEHKVLLNERALSLMEDWLSRRFAPEDPVRTRFREIVALHELYHAWEELHPDIYTRNVCVPQRLFGLFHTTARVETASEIGAIHFSKIAAGVSFCPCVYMQYLRLAAEESGAV